MNTTQKTLTIRVSDLEDTVEEMKETMKEDRQEAKANSLILLAVKQQVDSLVAICKWLLGIISTATVSILVVYIAHLFNR